VSDLFFSPFVWGFQVQSKGITGFSVLLLYLSGGVVDSPHLTLCLGLAGLVDGIVAFVIESVAVALIHGTSMILFALWAVSTLHGTWPDILSNLGHEVGP